MIKKSLKERLQKLAGILKEQDVPFTAGETDPCNEYGVVGYGISLADNTIPTGVEWAPSYLGYDGPNEIYDAQQSTDTDPCINMILSDIVDDASGNPPFTQIMNWVMQAIFDGNSLVSYDTPFDYVFWLSTQDPYNMSWYTYTASEVPVGGCVNPGTGFIYRRFRSIQFTIPGVGTLYNGGYPDSWAELFNAIESVQPLVAEGNPTWWSRFQSFDDLNNFLSNPEFNLGSVTIQCGAQGGCIGTCMCECYQEAECGSTCNVVYGCADPNASNYNPEATPGNPCSNWSSSSNPFTGSPVYTALALYAFDGFWYDNPSVTPGCGCVYNVGCTNPLAENFDTNITNILGGSEASVSSQTLNNIIYGGQYVNPSPTFSSFCSGVYPGSTEGLFDTPDYTPLQYLLECVVETGIFTSNEECGEVRPGCTDETAENYDPDATYDDGTCVIKGCTVERVTWATTVNPPNDGYYGYSQNYNPDATDEDGSCIFPEVCCDPNATNTITSTPSYIFPVQCDNVDGTHISTGNVNPVEINYIGFPVNNDLCEYPKGYYGCTDPEATNYNPDAEEDDDSCEYVENQVCPESGTIMPASCFAEVDQFEDSYQAMIVNIVNSPQFEQEWCIQGCALGEPVNYPEACDCCCPEWLVETEGCTDEEATNYNPAANIDDESCEYPSCFKFNGLEPDQQVDLCIAYFDMIEGGQQYDPNLASLTEEGACCKGIIIEPTKDQPFCCDFNASNFQPFVNGIDVNLAITQNSPLCDNSLCVYKDEGEDEGEDEDDIKGPQVPNTCKEFESLPNQDQTVVCYACNNGTIPEPLSHLCKCCDSNLRERFQKLANIKPRK